MQVGGYSRYYASAFAMTRHRSLREAQRRGNLSRRWQVSFEIAATRQSEIVVAGASDIASLRPSEYPTFISLMLCLRSLIRRSWHALLR